MNISRFVGVDANRDTIEASIRPTGELLTLGSDERGMISIAEKLSFIQPELIVMQANGSFELSMAGIFATAGLPFAFVQPRMVRDFARAIGRVTAFGQSCAGLLAHFGELVRPQPEPLSEELLQQLRDLRGRREEILQMIELERCRAKTAPAIIQRDLHQHIQCLERSLSGLDDQFSRAIRVSRIWK